MYKDNIMRISKLALLDNSNKKIDASIGMYYKENKTLESVTVLNRQLKKNINKVRMYSLEAEKFSSAIIKWLHLEDIKDKVRAYYTLGGTGGLSLIFKKYCKGTTLYLPNIRWNNYDLICKENNVKINEYPYIVNEKFDIDLFKKKIQKDHRKQLNILINTPCHNPTGYSLNLEELNSIFEYLRTLNTTRKINLIFDLAYLDFSEKPVLFLDFIKKNITININIFLVYSFSKTFGLYGYRAGAVLLLSSSIEELSEFDKKSNEYIRSTHSSSNNLLVTAFSDVVLNKKKNKLLNKQVIDNHLKLKRRRDYFLSLCKRYYINYVDGEGFFVFIPIENSIDLVNRLIDEHIYIIPYEKGIRVSVASINKREITILVKVLKNYI